MIFSLSDFTDFTQARFPSLAGQPATAHVEHNENETQIVSKTTSTQIVSKTTSTQAEVGNGDVCFAT